MLWKHIDFPLKKKFRAQRSVKEVTLTMFWNMDGRFTFDFLEKGEIKQCFILPTP